MCVRRVKYVNEIYWRVTEVKELFFYTLYKFHAYWDLGKIDAGASKRIKNLLGVDVAGYKVILRSNELLHFLYRHYNEKQYKQRNVKIQDIEQLSKVVNGFSYVENTGKSLLFKTHFPNNELFVVAMEVDETNKRLLGKSFRIET